MYIYVYENCSYVFMIKSINVQYVCLMYIHMYATKYLLGIKYYGTLIYVSNSSHVHISDHVQTMFGLNENYM